VSADGTVPARTLPAHTAWLVASLPFGRRTRIMDVGANPANRPAYADLVEAGAVEVHGFEPGKVAFQRLEEAKGPNEIYHPHAVGRGEEATFHALENGSFSSLYRPDMGQIAALGHWHNSMRIEAEIPVTTVALDRIADLPHPDMLKMDTQGAELEILEGGRGVLSEAVVVMPEVRFFRLYEGEPMLGRVDQCLREMGFMLHKILPGAMVRLMSSRIDRLRPAMTRSQMVDADAIYVRDIARPNEMSDAQIAHLALLADAVFTSMDLVLLCLDLLVARNAIAEEAIDTYITKLPQKFLAQQA
jgi:FkbM family methyltransferase